MWHISHLRSCFVTIVLAGNLACGQGEGYSSSSESIVGGTQTLDRPEIGRLHFSNNGFCTGTLVAKNVVITAAHCVDYRSPRESSNTEYGYFVVERSDSPASWYPITGIKSFGRNAGERDIALLKLANEVPSHVATPTTLAHEEIAAGSEITIFGYGCTERERQRGSGIKRAFETSVQNTFNLCPGDSGGPVVIGRNGPVLHINSAFYVHSGRDIFAKPFQLRNELLAQIQAWSGNETSNPLPAPNPIERGNQNNSDTVPQDKCYAGSERQTAINIENIKEASVCAGRDSWLKVHLKRGQHFDVQVTFEHSQGDIDMSFHSDSGRRFRVSQGTKNQERIDYRIRRSGTYYLKIYGYAGAQNIINIAYSN